jgi:hypothetical protein
MGTAGDVARAAIIISTNGRSTTEKGNEGKRDRERSVTVLLDDVMSLSGS